MGNLWPTAPGTTEGFNTAFNARIRVDATTFNNSCGLRQLPLPPFPSPEVNKSQLLAFGIRIGKLSSPHSTGAIAMRYVNGMNAKFVCEQMHFRRAALLHLFTRNLL